MAYLSYALFDDEDQARAALEAIEERDRARHRCMVTLHKARIDEQGLGPGWTSAYRGMLIGAAMAGVFGALSGGILIGHLPAAGGGAVVGAVYGAIAGLIQGAGAPSKALERLSKLVASGKVLLTVLTPDATSRDTADATLRAIGAHVNHRP